MFTGEYNHTIDVKGRLIVPNKFRSLLGEDFVVTKGLDGCLSLYENSSWKELENKLSSLPLTDEKSRTLKRFLLGGSITLEIDKQGRVLIPQSLRKYANLNDNVVFIGVGDYIEIWDEKLYTEKTDFSNYDDISKSLEGLGI